LNEGDDKWRGSLEGIPSIRDLPTINSWRAKKNKMSAVKKLVEQQYTFKEYLELEENAVHKSEYWNGTIVAMAGGIPNHNKISNSIGTAIDIELDKKNKDCTVYSSDQKVFVPDFNRGVYPDCMALCGEEEMHEESNAVIVNPSLIIEVLSKSTKEFDSNSKGAIMV